MNNFYNTEYLQERLAAVTSENERLREICERQAEMNHKVSGLALALDAATDKLERYYKAERDGRLFLLPCDIGDKVYLVVKKRTSYVAEGCAYVKATHLTKNNFFDIMPKFGKTAFLTRVEAEEAMK